ncbi:MAG: undecaprenyl-diphosphate phosphatase [Clostridia bacterium]|nr:undecaprenyl-diphosphate phosphatase [Clostridia bacterium]
MTIIQSIILGVIQGITEFFPISSSGHLIAARYLFGFSDSQMGNMTFDVALHFGTLLAIAIFFFWDFIAMFRDGFKFKGRDGKLSFNNLTWQGKLLWLVVLGCIPAAIAGILFDDLIEEFIRESVYAPLIIAGTLAIMGVLLYFADKKSKSITNIEKLSIKQALIIGLGQMAAIIPGFSRSGTTMTMARVMKLDRESAARFSFLLGAPVMLGAAILKFKDLSFAMIDAPFIIGVVTSFVVGILAIKLLMLIVKKVGFEWFAIYRVVLAVILVVTYIVR